MFSEGFGFKGRLFLCFFFGSWEFEIYSVNFFISLVVLVVLWRIFFRYEEEFIGLGSVFLGLRI